MSKFIIYKNSNGKKRIINTDHIVYAEPYIANLDSQPVYIDTRIWLDGGLEWFILNVDIEDIIRAIGSSADLYNIAATH